MTGTVLDCFQSYLSSRPFSVKCESSFPSVHAFLRRSTRLCSWPLLFIMYTTPLSSLISSLSLNHHSVRRWYTTFLSFHPSDVHSSIPYLISLCNRSLLGWLTFFVFLKNWISLYWSPIATYQTTEYLSEYYTHSARNLGFIFDTFSDQILSLSRSWYYCIRQLCCIRLHLGFETANTIVTSIVHSKLDYCNSVYTLTFLRLRGKQTSEHSELPC